MRVILHSLHAYYRPTAEQVMQQIISVSTVEDDAHYGQVNLVELIHKVDQSESKAITYDTATEAQGDQSMKRRIESLKVTCFMKPITLY